MEENKESFEDRIFRHLQTAYPDCEESFIRRYPSELMNLLSIRDSGLDNIDGRARRIEDSIPEDLIKGVIQASENTADNSDETERGLTVTGTGANSALVRQECMVLLNNMMQKVLAGEIADMCILVKRHDKNYEMMFSMPHDLLALYGFMTFAVQSAYNDSSDSNKG